MSSSPHSSRLLGTAVSIVLAITLTLGLWPFHAPLNGVKWLKDANGLVFNRHGTILGRFGIPPSKATDPASRTIEVWLQAEPWHSGSFLSFYNPEKSLALSMRESLTDFELIEYSPLSPRRRAQLYASDVFRQPQPRFIAVTSGQSGVTVYVNGVRAAHGGSLPTERAAFEGRLIIGDAPRHTDTWRGEIRGIAIYDAELSQTRILEHYQTWKDRGRPTISAGHNISHLYLMDEHGGSTIHDTVRSPIHLVVPERYTVLDKVALEPMWDEFELSRNFADSALKNIIGFVPLGICLYLLLLVCEWNKPVPMVVLAGFLVSLTIEILQIFLPTRESGTTDLITNSLGSWLGVLACQWIGPFRIISHLRNGNAYGCGVTGHPANRALTVSDRNQ